MKHIKSLPLILACFLLQGCLTVVKTLPTTTSVAPLQQNIVGATYRMIRFGSQDLPTGPSLLIQALAGADGYSAVLTENGESNTYQFLTAGVEAAPLILVRMGEVNHAVFKLQVSENAQRIEVLGLDTDSVREDLQQDVVAGIARGGGNMPDVCYLSATPAALDSYLAFRSAAFTIPMFVFERLP